MKDTTIFIKDTEGNLINEHSLYNSIYQEWINPVEVLPPVGAKLSYDTFDGKETLYEVVDYLFYAKEIHNNQFKKSITIRVRKIG